MASVSQLAAIAFTAIQAQHLGFDLEDSITATGATSQANGYVLTNNFNVVSVVTGTNNSVTLLTALNGYASGFLAVINLDAADDLYLWPASGESINSLGANNSLKIPAGTGVFLLKRTDTSWVTVGNLLNIIQRLDTIENIDLPAIEEDLNNIESGWVLATTNVDIASPETWTYASSTSFTISGDKTSKYQQGDKIRLKQGGDYKYFYIVSVGVSAGTTTVDVTGGSDYSLANSSITSQYFSRAVLPIGFPKYFNYTNSFGSQAGTFTGSNVYSVFSMQGRVTHISVSFTGNQTVSNSNYITFQLPRGTDAGLSGIQTCFGYVEEGTLGGWLELQHASTTVRCFKKDAAQFTGASGAAVLSNFSYYWS